MPLRSGCMRASDGANIPYRLWPANHPRALVICLHGAFDFCGSFDEIGPQFSRQGFTTLAIDQRGFGLTASRGCWSGKSRMTQDVIDAATFLRLRCGHRLPLFIVGESMGAALAVHAAARDPSFAGLVLVAPGAVTGSWQRLIGAYLMRVLNKILPNSAIKIERLSAWDYTPGAALRLMCDPLVLRSIRPSMLLGLFTLALGAVDVAKTVRRARHDSGRGTGRSAPSCLRRTSLRRAHRRQAVAAIPCRTTPLVALETSRTCSHADLPLAGNSIV